MTSDIRVVSVEFMDGEVRDYTVGGYGRGHAEESDGILHLRIGNCAYSGPELVAAIPLVNVREYKIRAR